MGTLSLETEQPLPLRTQLPRTSCRTPSGATGTPPTTLSPPTERRSRAGSSTRVIRTRTPMRLQCLPRLQHGTALLSLVLQMLFPLLRRPTLLRILLQLQHRMSRLPQPLLEHLPSLPLLQLSHSRLPSDMPE